jgi:subtilisin-like proprotein convertase family protein
MIEINTKRETMKRGSFDPVGFISGLLLVLGFAHAAMAAPRAVINAGDLRGIDRASVSAASELVIRDLRLNEESRTVIVRRVNPFAPDAFLNVDGVVQGALVSERLYFRGDAHANSHSQVSLSVGNDGSVRGVLVDSRGHWRLLSRDGRIEARHMNDEPAHVGSDHSPFECGLNNDIRRTSREARTRVDQANPQISPAPQGNGDRYRVRVAYDTTTRFVNLFGTDQEATDYLADLTNFISALYIAELNTEIVISSTTLRDVDEPWNPDGDLLAQFQNYWNDNPGLVDQNRTIAHIVDAGPSQGVAYVGALCVDGFDYGVSQGLGTEFDPNDDPQEWSFTVVAHELGHNFGSDHTHCYEPVIDECYNGEAADGCWAGPASLPGPLGQQSGTIMSYCHLLNGGLSNIATTLGRGHGFGVQPERVPNTMRQHVLERGLVNNPRCPQLVTAGPTTFTVTPSAGASGTIDPAIPVVVEQGNTAVFTVTPDNGFTATVGGTCGGNLVDNTFTTNPVNQNCTVVAQFEAVGGGLCQENDLVIPDDDATGVTSTLAAPAGGAIEKLEVALQIDHTWVQDLIVTLRHPGGTEVTLISEPGCSGNDVDVILDQDAGSSIQDDCRDDPDPAYPEKRYVPSGDLNDFNGLGTGGTWTLTVSDNFEEDTGTLRRWCLIPTEANETVFEDRFEQD